MASSSSSSLLLLALTPFLFLILQTQSQEAPSPSGSTGPVNVTGILTKAGQFTTFLRLLSQTQVSNQITNQLNSSTDGMTVFAPTDNAFNNLKAGTLNDLSNEDQVQLVLYHVLPKYYTLDNLLTVSNPVRTQSSTDGLNFTGQSHQVNVSTGIVNTPINNALRQQFPLAVYQVDAVLLPEGLFGVKSPASAPEPEKTPAGKSNSTSKAAAPAADEDSANGSSKKSVGLGFVAGIGFIFMAFLS
ncbi:hypothetical protein UlMin_023204 [Ulmus minor]